MKLANSGVLVASAGLLAAAPSAATSREAQYLCNLAAETAGSLRNSESVGHRSVLIELENIAADCARTGWDGYDALPLTRDALMAAKTFLCALPFGLPQPSVGADPSGRVTVEWYMALRRTVSISISADGTLHYAALLGTSTRHGQEPFLGGVPRSILDVIREVMRR